MFKVMDNFFSLISIRCIEFLLLISYITIPSSVVAAKLRASSAPYISGDTFRSFADHLFDETSQKFRPADIKYGDVIFVKGDLLGKFLLHKHRYIKNPYVLVCHNSDQRMPGLYARYLDDPNILAWFAQNVENYEHPKLINLPIGLANRYWNHGSIEDVDRMKSNINITPKQHLLYLNIAIKNYPKERQKVHALFHNRPFCFSSGLKEFSGYLQDLASCKFVLSPRGNGIDTHRTWEALYMGTIPIVRTSSLDPMYEGLPVVIVNDWVDVNEDFLNRTYQEMRSKQFNLERLNAHYWYKKITKYKSNKFQNKNRGKINVSEKRHYYFSNEPIDVVIPCVEKDLEILSLCIRSIRQYCKNIRRIIVVSPSKFTDEAEWFGESNFPFSMKEIALSLTKSEYAAKSFLSRNDSRCGWYFQQLLKLYAPFVIPDISANVLVVDADVVFLNDVSFQDESGAPLFNVGSEYHAPYFGHMNRLLPGLKKQFEQFSGISHWMLFQHSILEDLFQNVENRHGQEFWKVFCSCVDQKEIHAAGASEYEIYFNFALSNCIGVKINQLKWLNVSSMDRLNEYKTANNTYIACHAHMRDSK